MKNNIFVKLKFFTCNQNGWLSKMRRGYQRLMLLRKGRKHQYLSQRDRRKQNNREKQTESENKNKQTNTEIKRTDGETERQKQTSTQPASQTKPKTRKSVSCMPSSTNTSSLPGHLPLALPSPSPWLITQLSVFPLITRIRQTGERRNRECILRSPVLRLPSGTQTSSHVLKSVCLWVRNEGWERRKEKWGKWREWE